MQEKKFEMTLQNAASRYDLLFASFKPRPADPVIRSVGLSPLIEIELQVLIHIRRRGGGGEGLPGRFSMGLRIRLPVSSILCSLYAAMNLEIETSVSFI